MRLDQILGDLSILYCIGQNVRLLIMSTFLSALGELDLLLLQMLLLQRYQALLLHFLDVIHLTQLFFLVLVALVVFHP